MCNYEMNPPIAPRMPEHVQEVFVWCHSYHCQQRRMYQMCRQLFDQGPQVIHILNLAAPMFFSDVRTAFYDSMHLNISRLTDSAETRKGKDQNVCFDRLIMLVELDRPDDVGLHSGMRALLEDANKQAAEIRDKRNKMIAHNDLPTLTGGQERFLNAGKARFEAIFECFDKILNRIQECYGGHRIPRDFLEVGSDAKRLIDRLRITP